jgi:hypothetical protein
MDTVDESEDALNVEDFVLSNNGVVELHPLQLVDGSQRSDDPVSRITLKESGGVPTLIVPK